MADWVKGSLDAMLPQPRRAARPTHAIGHNCEAAWGGSASTAFIEMAGAAANHAGIRVARPSGSPAGAAGARCRGARCLAWAAAPLPTPARPLSGVGAAVRREDADLRRVAAHCRLAGIDLYHLDPRLADTQFEIAVDVDNPCAGNAARPIRATEGLAADVGFLDSALARAGVWRFRSR